MSRRRRSRRQSSSLILLFLLLIAIAFAWQRVGLSSFTATVSTSAPGQTPLIPLTSGTQAALPILQNKPQPKEITYLGCPPVGDGGDPQLNQLKNRVDEGDYIPAAFQAISSLSWPKSAERIDTSRRTPEDQAIISQYEGTPVSVEGFLAGAREAGTESCNCHGTEAALLDWHIWLTASPGEDRSQSIVVETTPRVRASHPNWTLPKLTRLVKAQQEVRISGWVMFDPEHPEQLKKTRGTLWEIHPIMKIEVKQGDQWISLDDL